MATVEVESVPVLEHDRVRTIDALTGIRAFAAIWVVLYHFKADLYAIAPGSHRWTSWLVDNGYLGVDLFFALSGFILSYNYLHRLGGGWTLKKHGEFLWLRLARVYPVQLFTLNAFVLLLVGAHVAGFSLHLTNLDTSVRAWVENVFMVQAWWGQQESFNGQAWSVSSEWFAYLLFPLAALALIRFRTVVSAAVGVVAAYGVLIAVWVCLYWNQAPYGANALLRVACEFIGGALLFVIWERTHQQHPDQVWSVLTFVTLVGMLTAVWKFGALNERAVIVAPLLGILIFTIAMSEDSAPLSWLLSTRAAIWGGEVSYCLYMTHGLVQPVINHLFSPSSIAAHGFAVRAAIGVGIALVIAVAAVATYYLIEVPARRRMRRLAV